LSKLYLTGISSVFARAYGTKVVVASIEMPMVER